MEYDKKVLIDGKQFTHKETIGHKISVDKLMQEIMRDKIYYEESGGGVTFSGGEPLMQPGFLLEVMEKCKNNDLHICLDTCGYADQVVFEQVMPYADLFLYDLKLMKDDGHMEYTGVSNNSVLKNLNYLAEAGADVIIRYPLIPGKTDNISNLESIGQFMRKNHLSRIDILPFHDLGRHKYSRMNIELLNSDIVEPENEVIEEARQYFMESGFEVSIGG
jgi:pyruvate formate lyase activating enzyme